MRRTNRTTYPRRVRCNAVRPLAVFDGGAAHVVFHHCQTLVLVRQLVAAHTDNKVHFVLCMRNRVLIVKYACTECREHE
jgi:hypothetical protein